MENLSAEVDINGVWAAIRENKHFCQGEPVLLRIEEA
jgi:hypothetical protein